jgi:formylglycine-generating enzyme required for sulfatase activity
MKIKIAVGMMTLLMGVLFSFFLWDNFAQAEGRDAQPGMILIPKGSFTMGSTQKDIQWVAEKFFSASLEWYLDETPAHKVNLKAFYIDKHEVTNEEFLTFRESVSGRNPKFMEEPKFNKPRYPVVGIAWQEAVDYCRWMKKRLPTEAEWEKAARGDDARYYPWGNEPDNTKSNVRGLEDENRYTAPVGDYEESRSPFGVYDMAGNVWEWTSDWYQPYAGNTQESDLYGTTLKVIKGGSWHSNMDLARSAIRGKAIPYQPQNYIGFRCARDF